ncbi:MAG TPA: DUF255 domain-containing protein [Candidatus Baltobacteraceae bacterium]|nr:DUF255 domain-containing protein [Candidatus Baltobacteraceae bacterium]
MHFSPRPNRAHEIDWQPWSAAAFDRARAENKPVLLSISAVWCHWCHVMDETSYSDPNVIAAINADYVPVRVDNDRRPDVNARYNQGGWPTTAFLTPDGALMAGGTYLPPPQMLGALGQIRDFYRENREQIHERAQSIRSERASRTAQPGDVGAGIVAVVLHAIEAQFDEEYGGFGMEPKFPMTDVLELLLQEWRVQRSQRLYDMLARTLLAMSSGGMYDHVEGGFFRYSTTRDWSVPHFEKMSEDHGALLRILATLVRETRNPQFRATLTSACTYVRTVLLNGDSGLFAGSQDADEAYFALPLEERKKLQAPYVDRTSYSNWSAGLAAAFVMAGNVLEDDALLGIGIRALDALHALRDENGLLFHVLEPGAEPTIRGLLTDQAAYLRALLDAHGETGEPRFFERACEMADEIVASFAAGGGGFYDHASIEEQIGNLDLRERPLSDNAVIADCFLRLAALTHEGRFRELAHATLAYYAQAYERSGIFAAAYARAVRRYTQPAATLEIAGAPDETRDLREAALRLPVPLLAIRTGAPHDGQESAHAYYCIGEQCAPPAASATELRAAFEALTPA